MILKEISAGSFLYNVFLCFQSQNYIGVFMKNLFYFIRDLLLPVGSIRRSALKTFYRLMKRKKNILKALKAFLIQVFLQKDLAGLIDSIELKDELFSIEGTFYFFDQNVESVDLVLLTAKSKKTIQIERYPDNKVSQNPDKKFHYCLKNIKKSRNTRIIFRVKFAGNRVKNIPLSSMGQEYSEEDLYRIWVNNYDPQINGCEKSVEFPFMVRPLISIIVPVYNTPVKFLMELIDCVKFQTYPNWELCFADGGNWSKHTGKLLKTAADQDKRIKVKFLEKNLGIVGNSNEAISLSSGDYIALLDHDDLLSVNALFEVVKAINQTPGVDFIYSDEDKIVGKNNKRIDPHFKPDYSPDLLRSYNYITHLSVIKKEIGDHVGWFRSGFDGSQDYDLILRVTEKAKIIRHIPKVLYHWRICRNSTAGTSSAKMYAYDSARKA